jgi:hypothetical protein
MAASGVTKIATFGIGLALAVAMYGVVRFFHVAHADWLAGPIGGVLFVFLQPRQSRNFGMALSALAATVAGVLCADLFEARGIAHPVLWAFGVVSAASCAIGFGYRRVPSFARRLWLGL